jgi:hypothetical protein
VLNQKKGTDEEPNKHHPALMHMLAEKMKIEGIEGIVEKERESTYSL